MDRLSFVLGICLVEFLAMVGGVIKLICRLRFRGVIVGVGPTNIIRSRILFGCEFGQVTYL